MKLLIKNAHIIIEGTYRKADILSESGIITDISDVLDIVSQTEDMTVINACGNFVIPGLIDLHCHLRDPGDLESEDIYSGSESAVRGGFTSIACMPNTYPVIDNEETIKYIIEKAKNAKARVLPIAAITYGSKGEMMTDFAELKRIGAVAVSDDGKPVTDSSVMKNALIEANKYGLALISHCEDMYIAEGGAMNDGEVADRLGYKGIHRSAEEIMIARDIVLAETTGTFVHIAHVSTFGGVQLIREAKKRKVKVTCETCPHYFTLTEDAAEYLGTNAKMNPPLRTKQDRAAVIKGLADGTIDIIATDHAPHKAEKKALPFNEAAFGIIGFETALALANTYLIKTGVMKTADLIDKFTVNPAKIFAIDSGCIAVGKRADMVVFDPDFEWTVDVERFASKSKNSPYNGFKLTGKVLTTVMDGKIVYDCNNI